MTEGRLSSESGFTLVEMAVVLVVIGLIILTVFPAMTAVRTSSQRAATQTNLQALMLSTAAYVQANGCVPCPTPAITLGAGFGHVGGIVPSPTAPSACVACPVAEGIPPYVSLGIPAGTAKDGWGHWITMRVDPALTNPPALVTPPTKSCTCTLSNSTTCTPSITGNTNCTCAPPSNNSCVQPTNGSAYGLCAAGLSAADRVRVQTPFGDTQPAAILFVSHGMTGAGSFVADATNHDNLQHGGCHLGFASLPAACTQSLSCGIPTGLGAAECNASGGTLFVNAQTSTQYDDMMAFADRNTLVSMLGGGSCQTVW